MSEGDATASTQPQNPIETSDSISGTTPIPIPERPSSEIPSIATPTAPTGSCEDGIWNGDVRTESDLIAARDCIEITGSIWIAENISDLTEIEFPVLERVYGHVFIDGLLDLTTLSMPALITMGSLSITKNDILTDINLPIFATVNNDIAIKFNDALIRINLPVLTTVNDDIVIRNNTTLIAVSFPVLTTVNDDLIIEHNDALTGFSFPVLTTVSDIYINNNVSLTDCELGSYTDSDCP